ncbi:hypothetical protein [Asticcacaulis sp.]|uniref:hypothetical protein n=1 Tax=Asticcacaulis sp. TaxID=1872648 RepID=UPI003F7C24FC
MKRNRWPEGFGQKPNGVFKVRKVVPKELRAILKRDEFNHTFTDQYGRGLKIELDALEQYARRKFGELFSAQMSGGRPALTLKRRLRRSRDDDFHDRFVELTLVHAGGAQRVHQLIIGRGVEAFFNDNYECTVSYAPPDTM